MDRAKLKSLALATGCAEERGGFVFLCDPHWSADERAQAEAALTHPATDSAKTENPAGWLCVRTGGTTGGVKFARHDEATVSAAARGFCEHFGLAQVNAVDVLPAHHVSGLMARVRCGVTGGTHLPWDWKRLEQGERPRLPAGGPWVVSLVPTQLQRLLTQPDAVAWLRQFQIVFLGGGPTWPELADAAAHAGLRVSLSYGMTETAAMVTALRPEEFLAGARSCGRPLPHVQVSLTSDGALRVAGASLFHGYFPEWRAERAFTTEDLGRFDEDGALHLLGRRDAMIVSGGRKIDPATVEAALRASGEFIDVAVVGVADAEWGEAVVACYLTASHRPDEARAVARLASHERPKRFVAISDWPRNAQGKINRQELRRRVLDALASSAGAGRNG